MQTITKLNQDAEPSATAPVRVQPVVRPHGPRLKCDERSSNHFYGGYKGHSVGIERDRAGQRWSFRVLTPEGGAIADGVRDGDETMREVIIYALTGAKLWPNRDSIA